MPTPMSRWTGELTTTLPAGTRCQVAASLCLTSSGDPQVAPPITAIFFTGDKVENTGDKTIEELSDSSTIAKLLVSKLGSSVNAWVISAAAFHGPFAVYREFIPTVNYLGDPMGYDPEGFPASKSIVSLLSECIHRIGATSHAAAMQFSPRILLIGFSKGGIVLNQMLSEISFLESESQVSNDVFSFLRSISEFHYVDVGLNCTGAYLTDVDRIKRMVKVFRQWGRREAMRVVLHGSPRQWGDSRRPWIRKEKDEFARLLCEEEACGAGISFEEKMYFAGILPSLKMHFEMIKCVEFV